MRIVKSKRYIELVKTDIIEHSMRVARIAYKMSNILGIGNPEIIANAGAYHDLGKLLIIDVIAKPGLLSNEDKELIRMHPFYSVAILKDKRMHDEVLNLIMTHHAYPDGKGYPILSNVSDVQMILQASDIYDAVNSKRVYRKHPRKKGWKDILEQHKFPQFIIDAIEQIEIEGIEGNNPDFSALEQDIVFFDK